MSDAWSIIVLRVIFISFLFLFCFFFNDTATTEIYTLSLHDALPIFCACSFNFERPSTVIDLRVLAMQAEPPELTVQTRVRSEEHTSELQSRRDLVCRLLLEKKKTK